MSYRPIDLISSLTSTSLSYLPAGRMGNGGSKRAGKGGHERSRSDLTSLSSFRSGLPVTPESRTPESEPTALEAAPSSTPRVSRSRGPTIGLSGKKLAMARKLMDEALNEDMDGYVEAEEPGDSHGAYVVHLFCLAISSLLSALPTRSLTVHPEAVSELRSTLLSASDRLGLGLVSNDQVLAGLVSIDGRPAPASGDGCKEKEISERVVEMLVRVMMWIQWLELPFFIWTATTSVLKFVRNLDTQYRITSRAVDRLRGLLGGPAFTSLLFAISTILSTFAWIVMETVRRVAASGPPPYEARDGSKRKVD